MKPFSFLLLISFCFYQCSNPSPPASTNDNIESSSSAATSKKTSMTEVPLTKINRSDIHLKILTQRTAAFKEKFGTFHEHIPYAMFFNDQFYFIVAKGNWSEENWIGKEWNDQKRVPETIGSYKMGLVNENNDLIIPTEYDKIYTVGGVAPNLIEVELDGKLGAYDINGKQLLTAEFDAIYPYTNAKNAWVQVRKGDRFGWLSTSGVFSMDPESHYNKGLFKAQPVASLLTNWSFDSKKETLIPIFKAQVSPEQYQTELEGLLILPSYLYQLDLVPEFRTQWAPFSSGNGDTEAKIQTARKTGNNQTIVSAFQQYFADPRGYFEEQSDVITLDQNMKKIDKISIKKSELQGPCSDDIRFRFIDDNILEVATMQTTNHPVYTMMTSYEYHAIGQDGRITPIEIEGLYKFTQMIKISDFYFKGCFSRHLTDEEIAAQNEDDYINFATSEHLSIEDLDVMRNEIYARHGYRFKSQKWQDYFGKNPWYKAQFDNVDDQLSEIEKHNITAILNQKKKMEGNEAEFVNTTYVTFVVAG